MMQSARTSALTGLPEPGAHPFPVPVLPVIACKRCMARRGTGRARALCLALAAGVLIIGPVQGTARAVGPQSPGVSPVDRFADMIAVAGRRFGLSSAWITAVIRAESAANPRALSPKGAMGLMQLMPRTWADMRARLGLGADPFDPADNITGGAAYLRQMWDRFGPAGFLAAYNAGPARYLAHLATGRPLPEETRAYIAHLAPATNGKPPRGAPTVEPAPRSWTEAPLFVGSPDTPPVDATVAVDARSHSVTIDNGTNHQATLAAPSAGLFVGELGRNDRP